jgi:hypothetical protein
MNKGIKLSVSIGEALDKYSILEIKSKNIKDQIRLRDVEKEMSEMYPLIENYLMEIDYLYRSLIFINNRIWELTDLIRYNRQVENFQQVYDLNDSRFRVKTRIDIYFDSKIRERKNFSDNSCFIDNSGITDNQVKYKNFFIHLFFLYDNIYCAAPVCGFNENGFNFIIQKQTDLKTYDLSKINIEHYLIYEKI